MKIEDFPNVNRISSTVNIGLGAIQLANGKQLDFASKLGLHCFRLPDGRSMAVKTDPNTGVILWVKIMALDKIRYSKYTKEKHIKRNMEMLNRAYHGARTFFRFGSW